jgi:hypothetical protein
MQHPPAMAQRRRWLPSPLQAERIQEVHALFANVEGRSVHFKPYGVAFPKVVTRWMGVNLVWYASRSRLR